MYEPPQRGGSTSVIFIRCYNMGMNMRLTDQQQLTISFPRSAWGCRLDALRPTRRKAWKEGAETCV